MPACRAARRRVETPLTDRSFGRCHADSRSARLHSTTLARDKLAALERRQLRRRLAITARPSATAALQAGAELVSFSCNDYLGLSHHPDVVAASVEATRRFGVGAGSVAARQRQPSAVRRARAQARGAQGHRGRRRIRQRLSDERRRDSGARRPQRSHRLRRALPQLPARRALRLSGSRVLEFRHNDVAHSDELLRAERARASALPAAHGRRVQHGRRPGAARRRSRRSRPSTTRGS